jgi:hypothetical protein
MLRRSLVLLLLGLLPLHVPTLFAADSAAMSAMPTIATDGKSYAASFSAGLSLDNGKTFRTDTLTSVDVLIQGRIAPDPAHVGKKGDLFVVERIAGSFYMRNTAGVYVPWPTVSIKDLVPAVEDVTLGASHIVEVFKGTIAAATDHRVFLGYMADGGTGLIYTPVPLLISVKQNLDAQSLFENTIFSKIVIGKCTLCHVRGGVADGRSSLLFVKDATLAKQNYDIFKTFYSTRSNAYDYVLSKASGGDRHVGGTQLPKGSADYNALDTFLSAIEGRAPVTATTSPTAEFFKGVTLQSNLKTLRRAAILLAGRAPTAAEQATVASGGDAALRATLLGLMQGTNFHEFLKHAANDRLLVRGVLLPPIQICELCFPTYSAESYKVHEQAFLTSKPRYQYKFADRVKYGEVEAPLELIASIVENDRPYSEILTADYMMVNVDTDLVTNASATFSANAPVTEFKQARITEYYRQDASTRIRNETRFHFNILEFPGNLRGAYPHVGVLNDMAFLNRYPTTATNRNRARARWTYFHFLGVDIEQSAQRTTDPVALADTNNPTMNNPNCQVCHEIMDPVAGAFQHYGDDGFYLSSFGGMDALDQFYKRPETGTTAYRAGDTWYRDMRAPGFNGTAANTTDTLRWLAGQIVADPRFSPAAVRFWWPSVIGSELLKRPEVATDGNYEARLLAYDAQEAAISTMAAAFTQNGMKVKGLLLDMLMSEWFRAERIDASKVTATQTQAHWIANLGMEKLLTPEQLAAKTKALTGFNWDSFANLRLGTTEPGMLRTYSLFYGGIDSIGVTKRAREMTPLMSATSMTMALESSCPIVYGEFILPDAQRKLFSGITDQLTPLSEASEVRVIDTADPGQVKSLSFSSQLSAGPKKAFVLYADDYCGNQDPATGRCGLDRNVFINSLTLSHPDGSSASVSGSQLTLESTTCGNALTPNRMLLHSAGCIAVYKFTAAQSGTYQVQASMTAVQAGPDNASVILGFESDSIPRESTSLGAMRIREKLVQLHQTLLGQTLTVDSPEISDTFALLADSWQSKRAANRERHMMNPDLACSWPSDTDFFANIGYPGPDPRQLVEFSTIELLQAPLFDTVKDWFYPRGADPLHMKKSWQTVIAYMLSHYNYLYE